MKGQFLSLLAFCLIWGSSGKATNVFLSYQDSLGQYSFGYSALNSARSEVKTLNGATRGWYSYVDENGAIQSTQYVADDDGFRVIATNLPQAPLPVEETPEVSVARKEHLEAVKLAQKMAEEAGEAGDDGEQTYLSKESAGQSDENLEGSKTMEEVQTVPTQLNESREEEEEGEEEGPVDKHDDSFPPTPLSHDPYNALMKFPPPMAIHYVVYKPSDGKK